MGPGSPSAIITGYPGSSLSAVQGPACNGSATSDTGSTFTTTSGPGNSGPGCSETSASTSTSTATGYPGSSTSATSGTGDSVATHLLGLLMQQGLKAQGREVHNTIECCFKRN